MKTIIEKQILEWREELKAHKERLDQAKVVVEQENRFIAMIEGGIQAQEMLLKKIESADQPTGIVELNQESEKAPSKK
jgi:sugar-specific transcriptional regulator TrmB